MYNCFSSSDREGASAFGSPSSSESIDSSGNARYYPEQAIGDERDISYGGLRAWMVIRWHNVPYHLV